MLELLKVSDSLKPCPTEAESEMRRCRLRKHRDEVIGPVLQQSAEASRRFSRAWSRVPPAVHAAQLAAAWASGELMNAREVLQGIAAEPGVVDTERIRNVAAAATDHLDPNIRELIREGLELFVRNKDLSCELRPLVIRHRRATMHRAFLVGADYAKAPAELARRPDRHLLHAAPGMDVRGEAELPQYLLMRCVSESKGGKGRSALGSALTGCYSTLLESNEGRSIEKLLCGSDAGKVYFDLLRRLVGKEQDARHPKLAEVVDRVVEAWRAGEKTLVFCFRVNTARRLQEIIRDRILHELEARRQRCLGGSDALDMLRRRLTGRDRDLVGLGLDRVLWSFYWAAEDRASVPYQPADLELQPEDLATIARIAAERGIDLDAERPDRVFLHRAVESAIARRLKRRTPAGFWKDLLEKIAHDDWVSRPYGLGAESDDEAEGEGERAAFDERGVHTVYDPSDVGPRQSRLRELELIKRLEERRDHARATDQAAILDAYTAGPSLWLGPDPRAVSPDVQGWSAVLAIHRFLAKLTTASEASERSFDWSSRAVVMQALRRGVLRDSILLRLLPERTELGQQHWGELLAERFLAPLPGQVESMADRVAVFLDDLVAASGNVNNPGDARHSILNATRLRGATFVALVDGSTDSETRERIFAGFSTPLLPEVLICTSVGQEGIDLHRHCRRVVHYDLAWNPAVLEQRTGRVDRIGSKTFRERDRSTEPKPFLEVGVPFLAGTYDERMYEELRLRAQSFEVLTGGELAPDHAEGQDDVPDAEGKSDNRALAELPPEMVADLRVNLHVWNDGNPVSTATDGTTAAAQASEAARSGA